MRSIASFQICTCILSRAVAVCPTSRQFPLLRGERLFICIFSLHLQPGSIPVLGAGTHAPANEILDKDDYTPSVEHRCQRTRVNC